MDFTFGLYPGYEANVKINSGEAYYKKGELDTAKLYGSEALDIAKEVKIPRLMMSDLQFNVFITFLVEDISKEELVNKKAFQDICKLINETLSPDGVKRVLINRVNELIKLEKYEKTEIFSDALYQYFSKVDNSNLIEFTSSLKEAHKDAEVKLREINGQSNIDNLLEHLN